MVDAYRRFRRNLVYTGSNIKETAWERFYCIAMEYYSYVTGAAALPEALMLLCPPTG
jgi:hypothetical protein